MFEQSSPVEVPVVEPAAEHREIRDGLDVAESPWKRFLLVLRVLEVRLRFIAIVVAVGLFIGYWETIKNYWDKYVRPASAAARQLTADAEFFCPMHPNVVRSAYESNGDIPKCPICGMPLSVHPKGQKQELPPGVSGRVQISPQRIQLAGIKTAVVGYQPLSTVITALGTIGVDAYRVDSRVGGRVEKLYVEATGDTVREGDPLVEISSPSLARAMQELAQSARPGFQGQAADARRQLRFAGMSEAEMDEMARSGKAGSRLVIRSPRAGAVIDKNVTVGSKVESGTTLLEVASSVWIEANVYEKDVGLLSPEQQVTMEAALDAFPTRTLSGRLLQISSRIDPVSRTFRVRFDVQNPHNGLRRGMYATVRIQVPMDQLKLFPSLAHKPGEVLAVPAESVIDTGAKKIVYVRRAPGGGETGQVFEGHEVRLGPPSEVRAGGKSAVYYPVADGLQAGDEIAVAGAFLVDAETRLNPGAASMYYGASGGPPQGDHAAQRSSPQARPPMAAGQPRTSKVSESSRISGTGSQAKASPAKPSAAELERLAQLSPDDRALVASQRLCPISGAPLASMAVPYKIVLRGQPVFLCCKGCVGQAKREPDETLKKVEKFKTEPKK